MTRRNRSSRKRDAAPGWVWMLFGLSLGLVVAAGVYFQVLPPAARTAAVTSTAPAATPAPASAAATDRRQARGAQSGRASDPAETSETRFAFYEILPQFEVVVPEAEAAASPAARSRAVDEPGTYVLQAGAFNAIGDADRLKARIALLGIESRIQRVTIDDDVYHRVRIGPISDLAQLERTRRLLRDAHVDTLLMKIPQ